jgi:hypothetical protein
LGWLAPIWGTKLSQNADSAPDRSSSESQGFVTAPHNADSAQWTPTNNSLCPKPCWVSKTRVQALYPNKPTCIWFFWRGGSMHVEVCKLFTIARPILNAHSYLALTSWTTTRLRERERVVRSCDGKQGAVFC